MHAVRHGNGRDWWLLTHKYGNGDFYKYLISPQGITGPFIQSIGLPVDTRTVDLGQMQISYSGNKLVFADLSNRLELFDFDRCSGTISDPVSLGDMPDNLVYGYYGCSFSPDGNLLYASRHDTLFQFDLNAPNIITSKTQIYLTALPGFSIYYFGQHQLGPDKKIYISLLGNDSLNGFISVINQPDSFGLNCDFNPFSISLNTGRLLGGLPNMPNYNLGKLEGSPCDTLTNVVSTFFQSDDFSLSPNPASDQITLSCTRNLLSAARICVFNLLGEQVYEQPAFIQKQISIPVYQLPAGIYIMEVSYESKKERLKFVRE